MDVLVEVWLIMLHRDVDVCQLDLVVVVEVIVLLLIEDDVGNLLVSLM